MRVEFGDYDGLTAAQKRRERLVGGFRKGREEIQAFTRFRGMGGSRHFHIQQMPRHF